MTRPSLLALLAITLVSATDPVTGPAGTYTVTTTGPTRVTSGAGWVRIEWDVEPIVPEPPGPGPAKPDPTPPPVVTPPPAPTPPRLTGQVYLLGIYDQTKAVAYPQAQQVILLAPSKGGSATIIASMKNLGISWQPREINDPVLAGVGADGSSWHDEAIKYGLPCVIAIGSDGGKVTFWTGSLPADEAGALALGKQLTGK